MKENLHALKQLILDKIEGTPFFMEEVVQELFERDILIRTEVGAVRRDRPSAGAHTGVPLHLPPTVQGILAARIDRLAPDEKALLQHLAVLGREFPLSLVKQVIVQPEDDLYRLLSSLQRKEFLYEQPAFPEVEYIFKHALTQEVAYGSVLQERRKVLHEQTGQAIEHLFHDRLEEHYDELARHYSRSGNTEKAVEYLHLAGQQAVQRSSVEAINLLMTAIELLQNLPDTTERAYQELTLRTVLGPVLMATRGFTAPEVKEVYARAWELCKQAKVEETPQLFPVLRGLFWTSLIPGELQSARELGRRLLSLAQSAQDIELLPEANSALGLALFWLGEFAPARTHLEQGIALYDARQHRSHPFFYLTDPGVLCLSYAAWTLWHLGYPDQALRRCHDALTLAQESSHPHSLVHALCFFAFVHQLRRESRLVQARVEVTLKLSADQGFPHWLAIGTTLQGWLLAEQGQEEGIEQTRQGLAYWQAAGAKLCKPWFLALAAEIYKKGGRSEAGQTGSLKHWPRPLKAENVNTRRSCIG